MCGPARPGAATPVLSAPDSAAAVPWHPPAGTAPPWRRSNRYSRPRTHPPGRRAPPTCGSPRCPGTTGRVSPPQPKVCAIANGPQATGHPQCPGGLWVRPAPPGPAPAPVPPPGSPAAAPRPTAAPPGYPTPAAQCPSREALPAPGRLTPTRRFATPMAPPPHPQWCPCR